MRYAAVIEKATDNYSAYVPDLPGCVATGATVQEVEREIKEAIRFHLDGLREDGAPIPQPSAVCEYVEAQVNQTQEFELRGWKDRDGPAKNRSSPTGIC